MAIGYASGILIFLPELDSIFTRDLLCFDTFVYGLFGGDSNGSLAVKLLFMALL